MSKDGNWLANPYEWAVQAANEQYKREVLERLAEEVERLERLAEEVLERLAEERRAEELELGPSCKKSSISYSLILVK